jgi:hypothetical protein
VVQGAKIVTFNMKKFKSYIKSSSLKQSQNI